MESDIVMGGRDIRWIGGESWMEMALSGPFRSFVEWKFCDLQDAELLSSTTRLMANKNFFS
jgi:hypothetical protein